MKFSSVHRWVRVGFPFSVWLGSGLGWDYFRFMFVKNKVLESVRGD